MTIMVGGGWVGEAKTALNMNRYNITSAGDITLNSSGVTYNSILSSPGKAIYIIPNGTAYGHLELNTSYGANLSAGDGSAYMSVGYGDCILRTHPTAGTISYFYVNNISNGHLAYIDTSGTFYNAGGRILNRTTTNTNYTTAAKDYYVAQTGTTGSTITIGSVTNNAGRVVIIKDEGGNASANPIWIVPQAGSIDGIGSVAISTNYNSYTLMCGSPNWFII